MNVVLSKLTATPPIGWTLSIVDYSHSAHVAHNCPSYRKRESVFLVIPSALSTISVSVRRTPSARLHGPEKPVTHSFPFIRVSSIFPFNTPVGKKPIFIRITFAVSRMSTHLFSDGQARARRSCRFCTRRKIRCTKEFPECSSCKL